MQALAGKIGVGDHGVFDGGFGVAFEQDGGLAVGDAEDERIVVGGRGAGLEVAQDGGESSHVVGVGVGEGNSVKMADAAGPEGG